MDINKLRVGMILQKEDQYYTIKEITLTGTNRPYYLVLAGPCHQANASRTTSLRVVEYIERLSHWYTIVSEEQPVELIVYSSGDIYRALSKLKDGDTVPKPNRFVSLNELQEAVKGASEKRFLLVDLINYIEGLK